MDELSVRPRIIRVSEICTQALGDALGFHLRGMPGNRVIFEDRSVASFKEDLNFCTPEHRRPLVLNRMRNDVQVPSIYYTGKGHA